MKRPSLLAAFTSLTLIQLTASVGHTAGNAEKRACVASYESAQLLRNQQKLRKAREQLAICAQSSCPQVVAPDCNVWLKEIDAAMPTLLVRVRDERGQRVSDFKATVDGESPTRDLDTVPAPFDPGSHVVRVEAEGFAIYEQKVVLAAGEKATAVEVTLLPLVREPPPELPREVLREPKNDEPRVATRLPEIRLAEPPRADPASSKLTPVIYIAGGVSFLSLTSFAFLGLQGSREADELRRSCAPDCAKGDVDAARTKLVAANVALGVGIGAATIAGILFAVQSSPASTSSGRSRLLGIDVRPAGLGGGAEISTTFSAPRAW